MRRAGSLHGDVVDERGQPVADALILLSSGGDDLAPLETTDPTGAFSFDAIAEGAYELRVSLPGVREGEREPAPQDERLHPG